MHFTWVKTKTSMILLSYNEKHISFFDFTKLVFLTVSHEELEERDKSKVHLEGREKKSRKKQHKM